MRAIAVPASTTATITVARTGRLATQHGHSGSRRGDHGAVRIVDEAIAGASYRLQRMPPERLVDLASQPVYVDLDDVRIALEIVVATRVEQLRVLRRTSPLRRTRNSSTATDAAVRSISASPRPDVQRSSAGSIRKSPASSTAGRVATAARRSTVPAARDQQDDVGEGLRQVVVGARIECLRLVEVARLSRSA